MKRWIVRAGATSIEGLQMQTVPLPKPGPGEVRLKIHAVSLNRRDDLLLRGAYGLAPADFVAVSDGAGEIDALGTGVDGWSMGDRVTPHYYPSWNDGPPAPDQGWGLGSPGQDGLLSEFVVLPASRLSLAPRSLSLEEAACLPCAGLTAWTALNGNRPYARMVGADDRVLVVGTGGVSLIALLIAKAAGAQVVATTSSPSKVTLVEQLGAAAALDTRTVPNWGEVAAEQFGGFTRVVNAAGSAALDQAILALAPGGEVALMGLFDHATTSPDFIQLMMRAGSIRGTSVGSAMAYRDLVAFVDEHGVKPPIAQTFAFDEARAAYESGAGSDHFGKVVIRVAA
jgi:NADPH:quinone reductase-like Zn-dependent oxidoreductase